MNTLDQIKPEVKNEKLLNAYSVIFYFTGSIISLEPEKDGLPDFCSSGLLKNLPVNSMNPHFLAAQELFNAPCHETGNCYENVISYYRKFFADREKSSAWPAESTWPSSADEVLHKVHGQLNEFYRKYNYNSGNDIFLPADHLGSELLFMNKLISAYIIAQDTLIKESIKRDILSFTESHLLNWLPSWIRAIESDYCPKCFKGIALLILASVEDVRSVLLY